VRKDEEKISFYFIFKKRAARRKSSHLLFQGHVERLIDDYYLIQGIYDPRFNTTAIILGTHKSRTAQFPLWAI
jgi:hypothetical protein